MSAEKYHQVQSYGYDIVHGPRGVSLMRNNEPLALFSDFEIAIMYSYALLNNDCNWLLAFTDTEPKLLKQNIILFCCYGAKLNYSTINTDCNIYSVTELMRVDDNKPFAVELVCAENLWPQKLQGLTISDMIAMCYTCPECYVYPRNNIDGIGRTLGGLVLRRRSSQLQIEALSYLNWLFKLSLIA